MTHTLSERPAGSTTSRPGVADLLASATTEIVVLAADPAGVLPAALLRHLYRADLVPGVRFRVLVPDNARLAPKAAARLRALSTAGAVVRTAPEVFTDVLVVDGALAIVPADRAPGGAAVLDLPGVVGTFLELFARGWAGAVPLLAADLPQTELSARERDLLLLLSEGCTDDSAAARLDVSVRTVRRMVADLMHRLGARSRFQAGAKAAGRGWLLPATT
ncbi:helix-turn-helix transcriptional regulator [Amycolatopsis suaedae]|uniref:HTH luxR-type domain-containing protein n=1 Tax=Amycolatopsis suaedae TaxID=2510978 RepID=A0A4Q7J4E1_9PSEU|nr:LuxR C-terminal-related transcriptional regulator [Amycolatopsis suaedae]RZQ61532.1 hypothetical protein EWH70_24550 [Amycolatopsis suaedae]